MITIIILARNEAENLAVLLPSLGWADQILMIDDESTDKTAEICRRFHVKRVVRKLNNDFAGQRNFGLSQVTHGWVLFIDADERLSQELVQRVQGVIASNEHVGYQINRVDYFLGKKLQYGETKDVWLTRLARVGDGKWIGKVHERWHVKRVEKIEGELLHYSHDSVAQLFGVIPNYAKLRSRELFEQKYRWSLWEQVLYPPVKFLYTFIFKWGFLDGWRGLLMSMAMSWHSWLVRWYLWEASGDHSVGVFVLRCVAVVPFILLPFGQLVRGTMFGITVYGFELFMALAVIGGGFYEWRRMSRIGWPSWIRIMVGVTLCWLISFLFSLTKGLPLSGGLYWIRWCVYGGYGLTLWRLVWRDNAYSVAGLVRFVGYVLLLFGLLQYVFFPDMRWLSLLGWDDHYYRMIGTLFDPNFFGLMMVLLAWWVVFKTNGWERRIVLVMTTLAVVATYSRSSMVVAAILALLYGFRSKQIRMLTIITVLAVGIFIALPKPGGEGVNLARSYSIVSRVESWGEGWSLFKTHPIIGVGFNQYPRFLERIGAFGAPYHPSAPDNSWIYVLATTGIVGFGAFLLLLASWWMSESDFYSRGVLLAIMIHSMTNNSFFYPWVLLWWWLVMSQNLQEKQGLS